MTASGARTVIGEVAGTVHFTNLPPSVNCPVTSCSPHRIALDDKLSLYQNCGAHLGACCWIECIVQLNMAWLNLNEGSYRGC